VVFQDGGATRQVLLRDAVAELKAASSASGCGTHGAWPMYSKFFDNKFALPHHIHHRDEHAALTGQKGKPEAYYFPPQANNHGGEFPFTFFGFAPGTRPEQVRECLVNFTKGDNKITNLSQAYRLEVGTGWDVPPGILHAPGSLCTYEPQTASDVFAMYQSLAGDTAVPEALLWKDTPPDRIGDFDWLMEVIDWELNVDPLFREKHFMRPRPVRPQAEMEAEGYVENWICYKSRPTAPRNSPSCPGAASPSATPPPTA
jgi:hypothetical protein